MPRKQIWSGAVLAAVAASSLTGCSLKASDGTPQSIGKLSALSAADAIQTAERAVAWHPSAKVHTVLTAPTASETADVVASFGDHPMLQGTLVTGSGTPGQAGTKSSPAVPIRYADDVMYMKVGDFASALSAQMAGKSWLKMDQAAMALDPNTASYGSDVPENTSPSKGLTLLAAAKDLHKVGEEQRGGTQTVHYTGTLTGADATDPNIAGRNGLTAEDADVVSEALVQGQIINMQVDVWLGTGGLPVAMTFTEAAAGGTLTGEIDYSDWGTKVDVAPIPDSQSADFVAMAKQAEAAQSAAQNAAQGSGSSAPSSSSSSASASASSSSTSATPSSTASDAPSTPATPSSPSAPATPSTPATPQPTGSSSGTLAG